MLGGTRLLGELLGWAGLLLLSELLRRTSLLLGCRGELLLGCRHEVLRASGSKRRSELLGWAGSRRELLGRSRELLLRCRGRGKLMGRRRELGDRLSGGHWLCEGHWILDDGGLVGRYHRRCRCRDVDVIVGRPVKHASIAMAATAPHKYGKGNA